MSKLTAQLLEKLVQRADATPHQVISGTKKDDYLVVLTRKQYRDLRDALHLTVEAVKNGASKDGIIHLDLYSARKALGWSQAELGKRVGIPQSQISRIECHPDATTIRSLKRLAAALGVSVLSLIQP